jgi:hypothetical protein
MSTRRPGSRRGLLVAAVPGRQASSYIVDAPPCPQLGGRAWLAPVPSPVLATRRPTLEGRHTVHVLGPRP